MTRHFWKSMAWSLAFCFSYCSFSNAQDAQTTANLIQPQGWTGCLDQHPGWIWGGTVGGPCPVQRAGDGAILFSWGQSTLSQTVAVNQALSGTGIQIRGYEYSWTIKNANAGGNQSPAYDPLTFTVNLSDSTNTNILESRTHDYSYRINDWTTFRGTEEYKTRYSLAAVGNVSLNISSKDAGYWAGYYGPEINNISLRLRYSVDACAANPLSSPECPGYQQAYFTQQCSANPLYNSGCPGYAEAYFQLQCSSNPLYNPACPGYQQAYFSQQCSLNALFNPECPGYQQAYFSQQCSLNALYNTACPGYQQAYFNQQCNANQLYSTQCPLYQEAYLAKQCESNPLWSTQCPTYQQAFFNQQCQLNPLYNTACPGYQVAYQEKVRTDACRANPQSSPSCTGHVTTAANTVSAGVTALAPQLASALPRDPVAAVTEISVHSDPVVNHALNPPRETSRESPSAGAPPPPPPGQPLGTGITVPGLRQSQPAQPAQSQPRSSSASGPVSRDNRSAAMARSVPPGGPGPRDPQAQQQDMAMTQMATVPGFDAYVNVVIPDAQFYAAKDIYRGVVIQDNARAQRSLNQRSDRLHQEMINEQYRR